MRAPACRAPAATLAPGAASYPSSDPSGDPGPVARAWPLSPFLRSAEAAEYLRFPSRKAFLEFARRHQVPSCHRGRIRLFRRCDLDRLVEEGG